MVIETGKVEELSQSSGCPLPQPCSNCPYIPKYRDWFTKHTCLNPSCPYYVLSASEKPDFVISEDFDVFKNKFGLSSVAKEYKEDLRTGIDPTYYFDGLIGDFESWVNDPLYLVFQEVDTKRKFASLGSKRGNRVYRNRVYSRFKELERFFPNVRLIPHRGSGRTNMLFVTLTVDASRVSLFDSWSNSSFYYNQFISALRSRFGSISAIRVNEAHESGYIHLHLLLCFNEHEFSAHYHKGSNNYVIPYKEKESIDNLWKMGFTKVNAVYNPYSAFHYLGKYLFKSISYSEDLDYKTKLTLALNWVFQKRAFSISKDFSLSHLLESRSITQTSENQNLDQEPKKYELMGLVVINFYNDKPPPPSFEVTGELEKAVSEILA